MTKQREIKFRAWDKEKKVMVVLVYDKYWKRYNRSKKMINIGEEVFSSGKTKIDANDFYIQLDGTIIRTRDYASPATGEYGDKIGGDDVWNIEYKEVSDRYILLQYTGLKDNTKWKQLTKREKSDWIKYGYNALNWEGKEIYEGDIVKMANEVIAVCEDIRTFWSIYYTRCDGKTYTEVIGNIYENKDLLKT